MKQHIKIAILGGGGKTGKFLVERALQKGYRLKLLLRNPDNFTLNNPLIEVVQGDATDAKAINSVVENCQAVISTLGQRSGEPMVSSQAAVHVLKAMDRHAIKRYIIVAGINLDTPFDKKSPQTSAATAWMKKHFGAIHEDRQKAYAIVSKSNVDWTFVRVPLILFSEDESETIVAMEDCKGDKISAANISDFLIEQLFDKTYSKKSPFISNA